MIGKNNTIVGRGCHSDFNNCVVIGSGISATEDYQLIVGNSRIQATRKLTEDEYQEITGALRAIGSS